MKHIDEIDKFFDFLYSNQHIIRSKDYNFIVYGSFFSKIRERYLATIQSFIKEAGFDFLMVPQILREEVIFNKAYVEDINQYYDMPSINYFGGRRLNKSYIVSNGFYEVADLIFKTKVFSDNHLPLNFFSTFNAFEYRDENIPLFYENEKQYFELIVFLKEIDLHNIIEAIQSNLLNTIFNCLNISPTLKYENHLIMYKVNSKDYEENIVILKHEKVTDLSYLSTEGETQNPIKLSCRISDSTFSYMLLKHFDLLGFKIPSELLDFLIVIIPIYTKDNLKNDLVIEYVTNLENKLLHDKVSFKIDNNDSFSLGEKRYFWEKRGVPIRIEIGISEVQGNLITLVDRYKDNKKTKVSYEEIKNHLENFYNYWAKKN
jgi:hypothetical protein